MWIFYFNVFNTGTTSNSLDKAEYPLKDAGMHKGMEENNDGGRKEDKSRHWHN
jgi:hypothetical protein